MGEEDSIYAKSTFPSRSEDGICKGVGIGMAQKQKMRAVHLGEELRNSQK